MTQSTTEAKTADGVVIGVMGGSGLGDMLAGETGVNHELDTPFGKPSGPIVETAWSGARVYLLQRHGPGHTLNPTAVPYRANIYAMKAMGVTHLLASGATGSLREHLAPGELVVIDQVIDKTHRRANTLYEHAAVHVAFSEPFCPVMRRWLLAAATRLDTPVTVHDGGTYVCMEGPAFSTRAECAMHRQWGGDLIGMTAMPEAKLAREAEMAYAMVAMPTDYDCWRPRESDAEGLGLLQEIIGNLKKATAANLALMKAALADLSVLQAEPSPAHQALALGIWSDKTKVPAQEVERLKVLWGKRFD
ncbi:MAG: S-methyl-5'-thioadenosine phosphorylase [Algisphaera sp.]